MKREYYILQEEHDRQKDSFRKTAENIVTGIMLMAGYFAVLFCFISNQRSRYIIVITGITALIAAFIGDYFRKRSWVTTFFGVVAAVLILMQPARFYRGIFYCVNQWIEVWNHRFGTYYSEFTTGQSGGDGQLQVLLIVTILAAFVLHQIVREKRIILVSITILLFMAAPCLFGLNVSIIVSVVSVLGWFFIWIGDIIQEESVIKTSALSVSVILLLALIVGLTNGYEENRQVTALKEGILSSVDEMRYGKDSLPQGDMEEAYDMVGEASEDVLELKVDNAQQMYMKGFVGSKFDGEKWTEDLSIYHNDNEGILDWLAGKDFYASTQYAKYVDLSSADDIKKEEVQVKNIGAYRKYLYLPYTTSELVKGSGKENYDFQMKTNNFFGTSEYSFSTVAFEMPYELVTREELQKYKTGTADYSEAEDIYRLFAYQNYLDISDEEKEYIDEVFFKGEGWEDAQLYQITSQIRLIMQGMTSYTETPAKYTKSQEFAKWFMEDAKEGNAAYYATMAVLAYRAQGIPARYVEGYYLSSSEAASIRAKKESVVTLTQENAHAWAEVYMDGIGWLPIETIPGFYFADYTTEKVLDAPQSSVNIQNQNEQETLNGSTTDALQKKADEKEKEETVIHKTFRILGTFLLVLIFLWLLHCIIKLQKAARIWMYKQKLEKANQTEACRIIYQRVCRELKNGQILASESRPRENAELIEKNCGKTLELQYNTFIALIQKSVFGQQELTKEEYRIVQNFLKKITEEVRTKAGKWKRWVLDNIYL